MAEIRTKMETYEVHYICDECGEGEMIASNVVYATYPPQIPHTCTKCRAKKIFEKGYPYTDIVPVDFMHYHSEHEVGLKNIVQSYKQ